MKQTFLFIKILQGNEGREQSENVNILLAERFKPMSLSQKKIM